jgi:uncharacterized membrane protein YkvA (DUF1232 family)
MRKRLQSLARAFRNEIGVYRSVMVDPRCPRIARWLLGAAVAYALSPIDLIPDFIPLLGHLDDFLILPLMVWLAIRLIPRELVAEHRNARGTV